MAKRKHGPFAAALLRYMERERIGYAELGRRLGLEYPGQRVWWLVHRNTHIDADLLRRMRRIGIDLNELAAPGGSDDGMEDWDENGDAD